MGARLITLSDRVLESVRVNIRTPTEADAPETPFGAGLVVAGNQGDRQRAGVRRIVYPPRRDDRSAHHQLRRIPECHHRLNGIRVGGPRPASARVALPVPLCGCA